MLSFCGQVCGGRYILPLCYSVIKIHMGLSCVVCCENIYLSPNVSPPRAHCIAEESKRQQLFKFTPDQINCRVLLAPCVVLYTYRPSLPTSVHVLVIQCDAMKEARQANLRNSSLLLLSPISRCAFNSLISSSTFHSFLDHTCSLPPIIHLSLAIVSHIHLLSQFFSWLRACRFCPL